MGFISMTIYTHSIFYIYVHIYYCFNYTCDCCLTYNTLLPWKWEFLIKNLYINFLSFYGFLKATCLWKKYYLQCGIYIFVYIWILFNILAIESFSCLKNYCSFQTRFNIHLFFLMWTLRNVSAGSYFFFYTIMKRSSI